MIKRKEALILNSFDYGNTSKIIHILTSNSERVSLIAKGARKPTSRFGGNIETVSLGDLVYYIKDNRDLGILKEAALQQFYSEVKKDLYRLNIAFSFLWTVSRIPDPERGLFGLTKRSLTFLDRGFREEVLAYFLLSLFQLSGVFPNLKNCVVCDSEEVDFFDIASGGSLCKRCKTNTAILMDGWQNLILDLSKGRLRVWKEYTFSQRGILLSIIYRYGVYHIGGWLNRLRDILPFEIIPKER